MAAIDDINRAFREFNRYTGDGLPNSPSAAPLPVGDPSSGVHSPKKVEIRQALKALADETDEAVQDALGAVLDAEAARDVAVSAAGTNLVNFVSRAAAAAAAVPAPIVYVITAGQASPGDGGGALYKKVGSEPAHPGKFQSSGGVWWELAEPVVRAEMFGAIGNGDGNGGGANDGPALTAAFAFSAATGKLIHLDPAKVYRCDVGLSYSGGGMVGFVGGGMIDFTNCPTQDCITVTGPAWGAAHPLLSSANHPIRTLVISAANAAGYAKGDVIRIYSSKLWASDGPTHSEFRVIDAVDAASGTITLTESVCGNYAAIDNAAIQKVSLACQPVFDLTIRGNKAGTVNHRGLIVDRAAYGRFKIRAEYCNERSMQVRASLWCKGEGLTFLASDMEGLGYGLVDGGNQWCQWGDIAGHNCRHVYTGGDGLGQLGRECTIGDVIGTGCRDATIDTHSGCSDITFGNVIGSSKAGNGSDTGVSMQGTRITIVSININGYERMGLMWQFMGGDPSRAHFLRIGSITLSPGISGVDTYSISLANLSGALAIPISDVCLGTVYAVGERGLVVAPSDADIRRCLVLGGTILARSYHGVELQGGATGVCRFAALHTQIQTQSTATAHVTVYVTGAKASADLFGCSSIGGAQNHMRAVDGRIQMFGNLENFSGSGTKFLVSGTGAIQEPALVAAT